MLGTAWFWSTLQKDRTNEARADSCWCRRGGLISGIYFRIKMVWLNGTKSLPGTLRKKTDRSSLPFTVGQGPENILRSELSTSFSFSQENRYHTTSWFRCRSLEGLVAVYRFSGESKWYLDLNNSSTKAVSLKTLSGLESLLNGKVIDMLRWIRFEFRKNWDKVPDPSWRSSWICTRRGLLQSVRSRFGKYLCHILRKSGADRYARSRSSPNVFFF